MEWNGTERGFQCDHVLLAGLLTYYHLNESFTNLLYLSHLFFLRY
jgi:hypothetical protein